MFRNVPECSGMFHVPGFIDAQTMPPISTHKKAYVRMAASLIKPRSVETKGNKTLQAVIFKHSPLATKLLNQAGKHQEPEN